jgi:RNase P subunit RPR2
MKERKEQQTSAILAQCSDCEFKVRYTYNKGDLDAFTSILGIVEDLADLHEEKTDHTVNISLKSS